jgi:RNA polymerase sigma factor (sigma-70 family)
MQAEQTTTYHHVTSSRPDGELLRLYLEQESEEAFTELGRRYARLIYTTCLHETQNPTLAEDAAQGVYLLLSRKARSLTRSDTLAGWLYVAARYVAKNLMKQERRRQMNETRASLAAEPTAASQNPLWERIEPHFYHALDHLKPAEREAILLRYVQEQTLAEVGATLGVTENTARMRVNRALEKIRSHLARAGITVAVGALAAHLQERTAQAVPGHVLGMPARIATGGTPPSAQSVTRAARQAGIRMSLRSTPRLLAVSLSLLLFLAGCLVYRSRLQQPLSRPERVRLFGSMAGTWGGNLEFADDRTGQRFTYPTTVNVSVENRGDVLQLSASYAGTDRVDVTTLEGTASTGKIGVYNGGPKSSHRLSATGDLLHLRDGGTAFLGFSEAQNRWIRMTFALDRNRLTVQEEYRLPSASAYRFRNRFSLRRR